MEDPGMNGSVIMEGMREAWHRGTPMAPVTLPDLVAYVVTIAIVTFLWLQ
jgi:hypothetical protein